MIVLIFWSVKQVTAVATEVRTNYRRIKLQIMQVICRSNNHAGLPVLMSICSLATTIATQVDVDIL